MLFQHSDKIYIIFDRKSIFLHTLIEMFLFASEDKTIRLRYHHVGVYLVPKSLYFLDFLIEILNRLKELRWQTSPFVIETLSSDPFHPIRMVKLYSDNLTSFKSLCGRVRKDPKAHLGPEEVDLTEGFTSSTS